MPTPRDRSHHVLAALLVAPPFVIAAAFHEEHVSGALAIGGAVTALILLLFNVAGRNGRGSPARRRYGYAQVVLGADGRFSTSKAVVALWTLVFATSVVTVSALAWMTPRLTPNQVFDTDWQSFLLLLGGPFASAVVAKGVVSAKADRDDGAKSVTTAASGTAAGAKTVVTTEPTLSDVVTNDSGETDLVDAQYVIFSLVAVVYFLGGYVSRLDAVVRWLTVQPSGPPPTGLLPAIPDALLGLTGLAALTYVGTKAVVTHGLRLVDVQPSPVPTTTDLTITLVNLPASATTTNTSVVFLSETGQPTTAAPKSVAAGVVVVAVPVPAGAYGVTVEAPDLTAGPWALTVI